MTRKTPPFESGSIVWLGPAAGIQWRIRPILFRLIRELDIPTSWEGTVYLDGYELDNETRIALEHRTAYVVRAGVKVFQGAEAVRAELVQSRRRVPAPRRRRPRPVVIESEAWSVR